MNIVDSTILRLQMCLAILYFLEKKKPTHHEFMEVLRKARKI